MPVHCLNGVETCDETRANRPGNNTIKSRENSEQWLQTASGIRWYIETLFFQLIII